VTKLRAPAKLFGAELTAPGGVFPFLDDPTILAREYPERNGATSSPIRGSCAGPR